MKCPTGPIPLTQGARPSSASTAECFARRWNRKTSKYMRQSGGTSTTATGRATRSRTFRSKKSTKLTTVRKAAARQNHRVVRESFQFGERRSPTLHVQLHSQEQ